MNHIIKSPEIPGVKLPPLPELPLPWQPDQRQDVIVNDYLAAVDEVLDLGDEGQAEVSAVATRLRNRFIIPCPVADAIDKVVEKSLIPRPGSECGGMLGNTMFEGHRPRLTYLNLLHEFEFDFLDLEPLEDRGDGMISRFDRARPITEFSPDDIGQVMNMTGPELRRHVAAYGGPWGRVIFRADDYIFPISTPVDDRSGTSSLDVRPPYKLTPDGVDWIESLLTVAEELQAAPTLRL